MDNNRGDGGSADGRGSGGSGNVSVQLPHCVKVTPMHRFHIFSQTADRHTLSMHEAKRDIADQRNKLTRFLMYGHLKERGAELAAKKAARNK